MTLNELSQLYWLKKEIEADRQRLKILRMKADAPTSDWSAVPGVHSFGNKLEAIAAKELELEELIEHKIMRCIGEQIKLEKYIEDIPDSYMRQIFTMRFIYNFSWLKISMKLGGGNTEDAVRVAVRRYIQKSAGKEN